MGNQIIRNEVVPERVRSVYGFKKSLPQDIESLGRIYFPDRDYIYNRPMIPHISIGPRCGPGCLDYAGKTLVIHNRRNLEETMKVTIFVATLSYSDYFYIEGMTCCDISNWIRVNNNALSFFGGITQTITPDNCKVAVKESIF